MNNKEYTEYIEKRSEKSPCFLNGIKAFLTGGIICALGEAIAQLFIKMGAIQENAYVFASVTIIFITGLLTGIGVFDKIAKFGGGGALVPISGFSNAVASAAIEAKSEGFITGVASKMFTIAGPVIVYGSVASVIYGLIYWLIV
ncbi:MAG: SpoVA/SpoVAEb family sporulation membrane protein [Clostridia bacterium]|nr:SpoVA/SpoVAEb family sporulation membrane protein [Clostridia bacterium]